MDFSGIKDIMNISMLKLLKTLIDKVENLKGKKLLYALIVVFVSFTVIGILVGYFINKGLNEDETKKGSGDTTVVTPKEEKTYYEGRVLYVNPLMYPGEKVTYLLTDSSGKTILLLKSNDQKLALAENLYVKVTGKMEKLSDGTTDVLNVVEVVIKNASD